jgi:segregation and condensation protein A
VPHPAPPVDYGRRVTAPAPPADQPTGPGSDLVPAGPAKATAVAGATGVTAAAGSADATGQGGGFTVRLTNFTGPFDLLLQLISKHKLDVTEVALHQVTDEFIAYIRAMGDDWDLDEASEFLLIAATLLDLKAARLLPSAQVEDEEDLALLEARDLLFARLLQYKAFKEAAAHIAGLESEGGRRYPRAVTLEPRYAAALPDLVLGVGPERLAKLAIRAMTPKPVPTVSIDHVHLVRVSVREHAAILAARLRRVGSAAFSLLCADCASTLEVVARFLALLELYREGLVGFTQEQALGELTVRWTGPADGATELTIDEYAGAPSPGPPAVTGDPAPEPAPTTDGPGAPHGAIADPRAPQVTTADGPGAPQVTTVDPRADPVTQE